MAQPLTVECIYSNNTFGLYIQNIDLHCKIEWRVLHFEVLYTSCNFLTFSVLFKGSRDLARMIKKGLHTKLCLGLLFWQFQILMISSLLKIESYMIYVDIQILYNIFHFNNLFLRILCLVVIVTYFEVEEKSIIIYRLQRFNSPTLTKPVLLKVQFSKSLMILKI